MRPSIPVRTGPDAPSLLGAPPTRSSASAFRPDVEGLRAVAVLLVVLYHAGVPGVTGGYVGVDVFFVLSGFLITGLLLRELRTTGTLSLRDFWARRVRRLLPVSALVLVVTTLASLVLLPPVDRGGVLGDVRAGGLYVANWHFALTDADYASPSGRSPVLHLWSLSVEEQFYVVWPLLLLGVAALGRGRHWWRGTRRRTVLLVGVLSVVSLALSAQLSQGLAPWSYYGLHTRAWELLVGAGLALAVPGLRALPRAVALAAGGCGLLLVVGSALVLDDGTAFPGTAAGYPVVGTALLVVAGAGAATGGVSGWLSTALPRYVGRLSYSWYLWHWPCLVLLAGVGRTGEDEPAPAARTVLLAVAVSLVLAVVTHHLVEQPARGAARLAERGPALALGAGLTALVVALSLLTPPGSGQEVLDAGSVPSAVAEPVAASEGAGRDLRLRQTPEQARKDQPVDTRPCYQGYAGTEVEQCRLETGRRTVVLVGDSHAEQWLPAMRQAAQEHDWELYFFAKSLCPAADVLLWAPTLRGPYPDCSTWRAQVLTRIAQLPDVDAVVLARRGEYGDRLAGPDGAQLPVAQAVPLWEEGTRRTLESLTGTARRVVLLEPVPRPPADVPSCVSAADGDWATCAFPRDRPSAGRGLLAQADARAAGPYGDAVRRLDLTDRICPGDVCQVVSPTGTLLYRDDQHLTASGALSVAGDLGDRLQRLLP